MGVNVKRIERPNTRGAGNHKGSGARFNHFDSSELKQVLEQQTKGFHTASKSDLEMKPSSVNEKKLAKQLNFFKSSYKMQFFNKNIDCHNQKKYNWHKSEPAEVVKV